MLLCSESYSYFRSIIQAIPILIFPAANNVDRCNAIALIQSIHHVWYFSPWDVSDHLVFDQNRNCIFSMVIIWTKFNGKILVIKRGIAKSNMPENLLPVRPVFIIKRYPNHTYCSMLIL